MNSVIKEFLPLVIIAMSVLVVAGITTRDLSLILSFVLFLELSLLFYFVDSLDTSSANKIASKMMFLIILIIPTMLATIIVPSQQMENILSVAAIILIAIQIIIVYRNHQISVFFIFR